MTFVGFDLHKRYITACALDATGESIAEVRQLSTALEAVTAWLNTPPRAVKVVLEATLYWEGLATRIAEQGHIVGKAHDSHDKLMVQICAATDPIDCRTFAE